MTNVLSHLDAIDERLLCAKGFLANAKSSNEKEWREHNIRMIERERESEIEFLKMHHGIDMSPVSIDDIMSDDELLKELGV